MKTLSPQILAFYLGCEVERISDKTIHKLNGVVSEDIFLHDSTWEYCPAEIKPLLRKLSSMKEEEKHEWNQRKQRKGFMAEIHADNTIWLCSKHFDLFNLIENNLAIDKDTLK